MIPIAISQVSIYFFILILFCTVIFLILLAVSLYKNKEQINFYTLIVRENGRLSKVGLSFIVILLIIVYQAILNQQITTGLIELLGIIFAAELGNSAITKGSKAFVISKLQNPKPDEKNISIDDIKDL